MRPSPPTGADSAGTAEPAARQSATIHPIPSAGEPRPPLCLAHGIDPAAFNLRDYEYMPLVVETLLQSDTWLEAADDPFLGYASMTLWAYSWHQVPCGSIPSSDRLIARILGVAFETWMRHRAAVLKRWVPCTDGRYWHPFVVDRGLRCIAGMRKLSNHGRKAARARWTQGRRRRAAGAPASDAPASAAPGAAPPGAAAPVAEPPGKPLETHGKMHVHCTRIARALLKGREGKGNEGNPKEGESPVGDFPSCGPDGPQDSSALAAPKPTSVAVTGPVAGGQPALPLPPDAGPPKRPAPRPPAMPVDKAIQHWNAICGAIHTVQHANAALRDKLSVRLRSDFDGDLGRWLAYCQRIAASPFCRGEVPRGDGRKPWKATFDWAVCAATVPKVLNGNYDPDRFGAADAPRRKPQRIVY